MEVLKWIHQMLGGSSPQTGYLGSLGIIASLVDILGGHVSSAMAETGGAPSTKTQWAVLVLSVGLRLAKDANKTNSQHPSATALTVPAVSASPVTVLAPPIAQPAPQTGPLTPGALGAVLFLLATLALALPSHAQGAVVGANCTITWNANVEADLLSYRVYGTLQPPAPGALIAKTLDIPKPLVAAPTVSTTCAQLGLTTGGTLTLQVDAVDTLGNRSVKSVVSVNTQDVSAPAQPTGLVVTPNP